MFKSRLVSWGVALLIARLVCGWLSRIDHKFILFAVLAVGAFIAVVITCRKAALWTAILWNGVYGSTRVVEYGEYGGIDFAYGAYIFYWASVIIPVILILLGILFWQFSSERRN